MLRRLGYWLLQMLLCIDQLLGMWLRGWYYVWIGGARPDVDETISAWVGRRAMEGARWALIAERFIDRLFFWVPNHCRTSVEYRLFRVKYCARRLEPIYKARR